MSTREQNAGEQYPEVAPMSATWNAYDSSYEHYMPHRSPAPEYHQYPASPPLSSSSPRLSAASPPPEGHTQSPSVSDGGFRSSVKSRQTHFSEYLSPDPQIAYTPGVPPVQEKEHYDKQAQANVVPPYNYQQQHHDGLPPSQPALQSGQEKKPFYKRKLCIILGVVILLVVILAAVLGGVLGSRKSSSSSDTTTPPSSNQTIITGDPDTAVGGYLSPSYYSKSGAFNGSGLATAGANPGVDLSAYVFYQDFQGGLQWKLLQEDGSYGQPLGVINDPSSTPLNGTPLSIVNIKLNATFSSYYLFYIDEDYYINQRVLQTGGANGGSVVPVWNDGPVTALKLKTMEADQIGLQACPWKDFYGPYSPNDTTPTEGLHLWYATDETTFQQYDWHNGTDTWMKGQEWTGMDGHAGVGCQTWESWMFEYVFFVDSNQNLAGYWIDNNRTTVSTTSHPTREWTKMANVNFPNVAKSTSLGYTNYLIYQAEDTSIRGANITFDSENSGVADTFIMNGLNGGNDIPAIRGTHLTITALRTASGGAELGIFFQQDGNEVSVYTRDQKQHTGGWQQAASAVTPSGSG